MRAVALGILLLLALPALALGEEAPSTAPLPTVTVPEVPAVPPAVEAVIPPPEILTPTVPEIVTPPPTSGGGGTTPTPTEGGGTTPTPTTGPTTGGGTTGPTTGGGTTGPTTSTTGGGTTGPTTSTTGGGTTGPTTSTTGGASGPGTTSGSGGPHLVLVLPLAPDAPDALGPVDPRRPFAPPPLATPVLADPLGIPARPTVPLAPATSQPPERAPAPVGATPSPVAEQPLAGPRADAPPPPSIIPTGRPALSVVSILGGTATPAGTPSTPLRRPERGGPGGDEPTGNPFAHVTATGYQPGPGGSSLLAALASYLVPGGMMPGHSTLFLFVPLAVLLLLAAAGPRDGWSERLVGAVRVGARAGHLRAVQRPG